MYSVDTDNRPDEVIFYEYSLINVCTRCQIADPHVLREANVARRADTLVEINANRQRQRGSGVVGSNDAAAHKSPASTVCIAFLTSSMSQNIDNHALPPDPFEPLERSAQSEGRKKVGKGSKKNGEYPMLRNNVFIPRALLLWLVNIHEPDLQSIESYISISKVHILRSTTSSNCLSSLEGSAVLVFLSSGRTHFHLKARFIMFQR